MIYICIILTIVLISAMFRPSKEDWGLMYGLHFLGRLFYIIPILIIWLLYFILRTYGVI